MAQEETEEPYTSHIALIRKEKRKRENVAAKAKKADDEKEQDTGHPRNASDGDRERRVTPNDIRVESEDTHRIRMHEW